MVSINIKVSVLSVILFLQSIDHPQASDVLVNTARGLIRGTLTKTWKGRNIFTFYGIKYALAPVGPYRFKWPIPVKTWDGIYNATRQGHICMQSDPPKSSIMSEDCLYLDVYSADLKARNPVLVYVHGGSFVVGSKNSVRPDYMLEKDIVLVAMNYRLGPLGFFTTGKARGSGNWGLKDQVAALQWVQENIKAFGGDPRSVTLIGHSAGAFSVSLHLVSPMSRRLFHRTIIMGGSAMWHGSSYAVYTSMYLVEGTGCQKTSGDMAELLCMQAVPVETIMKIAGNFSTQLMWDHIIETSDANKAFLPEHPVRLAKFGRINRGPVLIGITHDELENLVSDIFSDPTPLNGNFSILLPSLLHYDQDPNKDNITNKLISYYLKGKRVSSKNIKSFANMISDSYINHGVHRNVELSRRYGKVYYYNFNYIGRYSYSYRSDKKPEGVMHGDELQYLFVSDNIAPVYSVNDPESIMVERMTSWWTQFAKTGDPNNMNDKWTKNSIWLPTNSQCIWTFYINNTCYLVREPFEKRFALWDKLFPL